MKVKFKSVLNQFTFKIAGHPSKASKDSNWKCQFCRCYITLELRGIIWKVKRNFLCGNNGVGVTGNDICSLIVQCIEVIYCTCESKAINQ